jgi:hypothetical protein
MRNVTVIILGSVADNIENTTSGKLVASDVLASVMSVITNDGSVDAREGSVEGKRIASIDGAIVVIIAKIHIDRFEHTSGSYVTVIISTSIVVVTGRDRSPNTRCGKTIGGIREEARVIGTHVVVITLRVGCALRLRRTKIGRFDFTSCWNTGVGSAHSIKRNRDRNTSAASCWIARIILAQVRSDVTEVISLGSEYTLSSLRFSRVTQNTSVIGTHVVVVTVSNLGGNGTKDGG